MFNILVQLQVTLDTLNRPNKWDYYGERIAKPFGRIQPNVFCLSSGIKDVYANVLNIPEDNLFVTPNGVNVDKFKFDKLPLTEDPAKEYLSC